MLLPAWRELIDTISKMAQAYRDLPCSRAHGQPATPSTVGKSLQTLHTVWSVNIANLLSSEIL